MYLNHYSSVLFLWLSFCKTILKLKFNESFRWRFNSKEPKWEKENENEKVNKRDSQKKGFYTTLSHVISPVSTQSSWADVKDILKWCVLHTQRASFTHPYASVFLFLTLGSIE